MYKLKQVQIEPTNKCNLFCTMCPRKFMTDDVGTMDFKLFEKILNGLDNKTKLIMHFRGEPLLNRDFGKMLRLATKKGFNDIIFATNATMLHGKILHDIFDSNVNFITYSCHLNYDGWFNFIEFSDINRIRGNKLTTQVSITEHELEMLSDWEGIDVSNKEEFIDFWKDKVDRIRIYPTHTENGKFGHVDGISEVDRQACVLPFESMVVCWDGNVNLCCQDWDRNYHLGNSNYMTLDNILNDTHYSREREYQETLMFPDDHVCKTCSQWAQYCKDSIVVGEII